MVQQVEDAGAQVRSLAPELPNAMDAAKKKKKKKNLNSDSLNVLWRRALGLLSLLGAAGWRSASV